MTRHEHYLGMREFLFGFAPLTALGLAYGPGHDVRRRQWERYCRNVRNAKQTLSWDVNQGFAMVLEIEVPEGFVEGLAGATERR